MAMRPTFSTPRQFALALGSVLALAGCSAAKPNPTPIDYQGLGSGSAGDASIVSRLGGADSGVIFGVTKGNDKGGNGSGAGIGVNAYLWRGALETLSIMPLTTIDPFGGVIITDWYTFPDAPGERFKATAYVLTRDLRSDGIHVVFFRQVLQNGQWVDSQVAASTNSQIEDKVLAKARQLREQAVGNPNG